MHAVRLHTFGPAENLRFEPVDDPRPGPGQVRVRVEAAGVHVIDTAIRAGMTNGPFPPPPLPTILGRDTAGVVDEVGPGVAESWLGRRVAAYLGQGSGGYAELALANVEALHALPDGVSEDQAVAMIGTGRTTMAILETAALSADDVVLVMAAAGGIGGLLVQAARNAGATVIGAAGGPTKVDRVRQSGATFAIDYTAPDWPAKLQAELGDRDVTVVLDGVGGTLGTTAFSTLGFGGRIVLYGGFDSQWTEITAAGLYARGLTATVAIGPRLLRRPGGFRDLEERALAAVAAGDLIPEVGQAYPLEEAARAHTDLMERRTVGKVILVP